MAKSKKKQAVVGRTLVTFVLDKSYSMLGIKSGTLEAFNSYTSTMKDDVAKNGGEVDFTLVQFDDQGIERTWFEKPIAEVPALDDTNYQPRGMTPLIDAAYSTIQALQAAIDRKGDKPKVVVCIQTDGQENASHEHTWGELKELIASKQAQGWQFNFMGAGIDAYAQATAMGLGAHQTVSYSNDLHATRAVYAAAASNAMEYRTGARSDTSFSSMQKLAAGDSFDPTLNATAGGVTLPKRPGGPKKSSTSVDLGAGSGEENKDGLKVSL